MRLSFKTLAAACLSLVSSATFAAAVDIVESGGWFESAYVTWTKVDGLSYNVYVQQSGSSDWTQLDDMLVRKYSTTGRADALGLAVGSYRLKVVPVSDGAEVTADAATTDYLTVKAHDRGGFAHFATSCSTLDVSEGIGAYKNDGTLKDGARVFYVTSGTAKTITCDVQTKSSKSETLTGMQNIINGYQKGYDTTPITFRIIGTIKEADMDELLSSSEGLQIKGKSGYNEMNITIEGVGKDATIHGFGFLIRNAASVELRNFAIMNCIDDCVSIDTKNSNIWVHNLDFFYGQAGSDGDQAKGDGTVDLKGDSQYITISYNHFWDSGKSSLCGMKSESGENWITYHHNWFDHSDSRHPRIRTMSVHVYNNYFDGVAKYGVGVTTDGDAYVENNYFRNTKYPMLISLQGSDVKNGTVSNSNGTFSSEAGGMIKAYGNYITGGNGVEWYDATSSTYATHFDAYKASYRDEQVPSTVTSLSGGNSYNNFDTDGSVMYSDYTLDDAEDVPDIVTGTYGAGRVQHGDFSWTFGTNEDTNYDVITALKTAITSYASTLVGFFDGTEVSNNGATTETTGSSDEGSSSSSSSSSSDDTDVEEGDEYISDDGGFFFFGEGEDNANIATTNGYISDGIITLVASSAGTESKFVEDYSNPSEDATLSSTTHTGSLQLAKATSSGKTNGGSVIFKCTEGISKFEV